MKVYKCKTMLGIVFSKLSIILIVLKKVLPIDGSPLIKSYKKITVLMGIRGGYFFMVLNISNNINNIIAVYICCSINVPPFLKKGWDEPPTVQVTPPIYYHINGSLYTNVKCFYINNQNRTTFFKGSAVFIHAADRKTL